MSVLQKRRQKRRQGIELIKRLSRRTEGGGGTREGVAEGERQTEKELEKDHYGENVFGTEFRPKEI